MVVALLDALSIGHVDIVANDSGGAIAQLLVARHPARVRTLMLTNSDVETDSPPAPLLPVIEMARAGTFVDQWLGRWLADKTLARSAEGIGGLCYADPRQPTDEAIECYFAPLLSTPRRKALVHAYALELAVNPLTGIESLLKRSTVPMRVVGAQATRSSLGEVRPTLTARSVGRAAFDGWRAASCSGRKNDRMSSLPKPSACGARTAG
jgi:haloalkane dehalogenase